MTLLNIPISDLLKSGQLQAAMLEHDAKVAHVHQQNKSYKPKRTNKTMVISDSLDGVLNPVDGKRYDSKQAYYAAVKNAGYNIVEDKPMARKHEVRGDFDNTKELKQAIEQVTQGRGL